MTSKNDSELRQLIGEAIGEASMCWSETPTGIFDSTMASKIVDRVVLALEAERKGEDSCSTVIESNGTTTHYWGIENAGKIGQVFFREQEGK